MEDLTVVKALNCSGTFGEHFEKKVDGYKKNTSKSQYGSKSDILRQFSVCRKDLA